MYLCLLVSRHFLVFFLFLLNDLGWHFGLLSWKRYLFTNMQSYLVRIRTKRIDESLHKLNKYTETLNSMKQHWNEMISNERSSGSNLLKMGAQIPRNPVDLVNQRVEDRSKNVLNKRARSSIAERVCTWQFLNCIYISVLPDNYL